VCFVTEHDDRVNDGIRRVSFKPGRNRVGKLRNRGLAAVIRSHIDGDNDVDMNVPSSSGRSSRL
jgi:hypothetical protein